MQNLLNKITQHNNKQGSIQRRHFNYRENHNFTFYVDVETTGIDPVTNDVIEICCLVTEKGKFEIIDKFHSYVRPSQINHVTWSKSAEAVHGFSPEQAAEFPQRILVAHDFLSFCKPYKDENNFPQLFVCHALRQGFWNEDKKEKQWGMFDYHFMEWFFRKLGDDWYYSWLKVFNQEYCLSTIWLASEMGYGKDQLVINGKPQWTKTGKPRYEGNGLAIWAKRIGFELKHHEAESDTECCLRVHEYLENR